VIAIVTAAALAVGFLAGLWAFKVKSRWCPHCGSLTTAELHDQAEKASHA